MTGFRKNCDILLDTILGTLFILCFLTYTNEGELFRFVEDIK